MKKASWELLSKTLCTLIGVLVSGSCGEVVVWVFDPKGNLETLVVYVALFTGWTVLANAALLSVSFHKTSLEKFKFELEFWAPLLAITTGFSCKKVWSTGQAAFVATSRPEETLLSSFLFCFILLPVMLGFNHLVRSCRKRLVNLDGVKDEYEKVWLRKCSTGEENVFMMSLSFIFVQACRFAITGQLPASNGNDPPDFEPTFAQKSSLDGLGTVFLIIAGVILSLRDKMSKTLPKKHERQFLRLSLLAKNVIAWSWYYEGLWYVRPIFGEQEIGLLLQAVFTTALLMFVMRVLHHLLDHDLHHPTGIQRHHPTVEAVMQPIALLIAWSWKQVFTATLKTICSERVDVISDEVETWILTVILVTFILPAWRWFVLPVLHPLPSENVQPLLQA